MTRVIHRPRAFSEREDKIILKMRANGAFFTEIAAELSGRTPDTVKSRYHLLTQGKGPRRRRKANADAALPFEPVRRVDDSAHVADLIAAGGFAQAAADLAARREAILARRAA